MEQATLPGSDTASWTGEPRKAARVSGLSFSPVQRAIAHEENAIPFETLSGKAQSLGPHVLLSAWLVGKPEKSSSRTSNGGLGRLPGPGDITLVIIEELDTLPHS